MHSASRLRWLLPALVLGAATLLLGRGPVPAEAHALLVRADPPVNAQLREPPEVLTLFFSEPLERSFSSVRVTDQDGQRVEERVEFDAADPALMRVFLSELSPGYVTVEWETVSTVDGHRITGSYPLTILNEDGSVAAEPPEGASSTVAGEEADPGRVFVKAGLLIAGSLLTGALAFLAFVTPAASAGEAREGFERRLALIAGGTLAVLLVAGFADFLLQASDIGGSLADTFDTRWGERWVWRHVVLILPVLLVPLMVRSESSRRNAAAGALLAMAVYLAITSSVSHAAAGGGAFWATASDFVHLLAASVWVGMLGVLVVFFLWVRQQLEGQERYTALATGLRRFSLFAVFSVALLLFTGVVNSIVEVGAPADLLDTGYGRALLVKLLLLIPLLAIALRNAYLLRPQIAQESAERPTEERRRFLADLESDLNVTLRWEFGVALAVLAIVALLVQLTPTRGRIDDPGAAAETYTQTRDVEGLFITLQIEPNAPGNNTFEVYLAGETDTVEQLRLEFTEPGGSGSVNRLPLEASNPPTFYLGQGPFLTEPGLWNITLNIRRNVGFDLRVDFEDEVRAAETAATDARIGGSFDSPVEFTLGATALLAVSGLAAGLLVLASLPRPGYPDGYLAFAVEELAHRLPVLQLRALISLGVLVGVGIALGLIVGRHVDQPVSPEEASASNPIPASEESIETGRMLFMQNCTQCHGETGRGDGPLASSLSIPPANLYDHIPFHPDQFFFGVITRGLSGVMPAFGEELTEEQRWHVLNFLRDQFGDPEPASR